MGHSQEEYIDPEREILSFLTPYWHFLEAFIGLESETQSFSTLSWHYQEEFTALVRSNDAFGCKKEDMYVNSRHLNMLTANKEVKIISPLSFTRDKATLVNICTKAFCRSLNSKELGKKFPLKLSLSYSHV